MKITLPKNAILAINEPHYRMTVVLATAAVEVGTESKAIAVVKLQQFIRYKFSPRHNLGQRVSVSGFVSLTRLKQIIGTGYRVFPGRAEAKYLLELVNDHLAYHQSLVDICITPTAFNRLRFDCVPLLDALQFPVRPRVVIRVVEPPGGGEKVGPCDF